VARGDMHGYLFCNVMMMRRSFACIHGCPCNLYLFIVDSRDTTIMRRVTWRLVF
jgi:hypothetical protein